MTAKRAKQRLTECPACGAELKQHTPETSDLNESWDFSCKAQVVRLEGGEFVENDPCRDALPNALRELNRKRTKSAA